MESSAVARAARRTATTVAAVWALGAMLWAATAGARPVKAGASTHRPLVAGHVVDLGCANPANALTTGKVKPAADPAYGGRLRCFAKALAPSGKKGPRIMSGPTGLGPSDIQSAYKLSGDDADGRTVAVVDAYDDPNAESDLATYRKQYGLPACTTDNGCFSKLNQNGQASPLPSADAGWAEEESLDLDAISAACPTCHITLVEANSTSTSDLGKGVDTAAGTPGVVAVSNSYGGSEDSSETSDDKYYDHAGVAVTASSGDDGYGVSYPAASPDVTGVGGTTLTSSGNSRRWTEAAWDGAGSGCSQYEAKPSWQSDAGCAKRTVADVSADADPSSGLAIYDTYNTCGSSSVCDILIEEGVVQGLDGWAQVGGTSLSSPLIASVYALAGNTSSVHGANLPYAHTGSLFDVTSGSNGSCSPSYLCTAGTGYDGPTGLGTPDGTGAF